MSDNWSFIFAQLIVDAVGDVLCDHQNVLKQISVFTTRKSCVSITSIQIVWPSLPPICLTDIQGWTHVISAAQMLSASWSGSATFVQSMTRSEAHWASQACAHARQFADSFMHDVDGLVTNPTELMQTQMSRLWLGSGAHLEPLDAGWPLLMFQSALRQERNTFLPPFEGQQ